MIKKIGLCKTLIKLVLGYGSVSWTLRQMAEHMLQTFGRKTLRRIKVLFIHQLTR